jgi:hypothetical protein
MDRTIDESIRSAVREFLPVSSGRNAFRESDLLQLALIVTFSLVSSASDRRDNSVGT